MSLKSLISSPVPHGQVCTRAHLCCCQRSDPGHAWGKQHIWVRGQMFPAPLPGDVSCIFGKSWGKPSVAQTSSLLLPLSRLACFLLWSCSSRHGPFDRRPELCGRICPDSWTGTRCRSPEQGLPSSELLNQYVPSPPSLVVIKCTSFVVQSPFMLLINLPRTDFKGLGGLLKCATAEISRTTEV